MHNFCIVYQHRAFFVLLINIVQCFSCTPKKEGAFHRFFDLCLLALNFILPTFFSDVKINVFECGHCCEGCDEYQEGIRVNNALINEREIIEGRNNNTGNQMEQIVMIC